MYETKRESQLLNGCSPVEANVVIVPPSSPPRRRRHSADHRGPPDGGVRAWTVCLASFWTNGAIFGVINSFGVLYDEVKTTFTEESSSATTSLVGSLCMGMTFLLSPVAAILTDKFGINRIAFIGSLLAFLGMLLSSFATSFVALLLTYGIMLGTGASLAYTPSLVILGHYFKRRLGLVNGIVTSGSSLFTVVLPLVIKAMLGWIDLAGTLQILAAMMALLLVCAMLFKPITPPANEEDAARRNRKLKSSPCQSLCNSLINTSIWRNRKYMVWAFAFPMSLFGYAVPYIHLVKHVQEILPYDNGPLLITCIGAASGVGRLVFGKLADLNVFNRIALQQLAFFFLGIFTMLLAVADEYSWLVLVCLGMGVCDGCFISLIGPVAFEVVGSEGASQAIGFLLGICSLPVTLGAPIAGLIYDHMGQSYKLAFVLAGVPPIVGCILMSAIYLVRQPASPDKDYKCAVAHSEETNKLTNSFTKESNINEGESGEVDAIWKLQQVPHMESTNPGKNNTWDANDNEYNIKVISTSLPTQVTLNNERILERESVF